MDPPGRTMIRILLSLPTSVSTTGSASLNSDTERETWVALVTSWGRLTWCCRGCYCIIWSNHRKTRAHKHSLWGGLTYKSGVGWGVSYLLRAGKPLKPPQSVQGSTEQAVQKSVRLSAHRLKHLHFPWTTSLDQQSNGWETGIAISSYTSSKEPGTWTVEMF